MSNILSSISLLCRPSLWKTFFTADLVVEVDDAYIRHFC